MRPSIEWSGILPVSYVRTVVPASHRRTDQIRSSRMPPTAFLANRGFKKDDTGDIHTTYVVRISWTGLWMGERKLHATTSYTTPNIEVSAPQQLGVAYKDLALRYLGSVQHYVLPYTIRSIRRAGHGNSSQVTSLVYV